MNNEAGERFAQISRRGPESEVKVGFIPLPKEHNFEHGLLPERSSFETGWVQKWAQSPFLRRFRLALGCSKLLILYGGRGRNRTYNLSVKSRMLCQLSYASIRINMPSAGGIAHGPEGRIMLPLKNIAQYSISRQRRASPHIASSARRLNSIDRESCPKT